VLPYFAELQNALTFQRTNCSAFYLKQLKMPFGKLAGKGARRNGYTSPIKLCTLANLEQKPPSAQNTSIFGSRKPAVEDSPRKF
jgi:hypothetical protein